MDGLELTAGISVLASLIAQNLNDEELALTAALFNQLGDTLGTIAAQRSLNGGKEKSGTL